MKLKVTQKQIQTIGKTILMGYFTKFMDGCNATYYNCGIYGWNWDAWELPNYILIDGNRSFPSGKRITTKQFNEIDKAVAHYKELKRKKPFIDYLNERLKKIIG